MQRQFHFSNVLNTLHNLLQFWYFRLLLCGGLLLVVSAAVFTIVLCLNSSPQLAGPCDPLCTIPS